MITSLRWEASCGCYTVWFLLLFILQRRYAWWSCFAEERCKLVLHRQRLDLLLVLVLVMRSEWLALGECYSAQPSF